MQRYEKFLEYTRKSNTNILLNTLNISCLECLEIIRIIWIGGLRSHDDMYSLNSYFSSRKSYNLLIFSLKTMFSGDVDVQHHPNITLNDTRSAPYHKGPAKRVMLVRSKNKNFLVGIFLCTMSELVQNTFHFQLENAFFTTRSCVEISRSLKKITRSFVENMSNIFLTMLLFVRRQTNKGFANTSCGLFCTQTRGIYIKKNFVNRTR